MNTGFVCKTKSTTVKFSCTDDALFIDEIILNGINRASRSSVALPKKYQNIDGEIIPFVWSLCRESVSDNGFTLLYSDDKSGCTYRVTAKGRADIDGPIEYFSSLYNTTGEEIRIYPDEVFSVCFAFDKAPTSWRFMKESGLAEGVKWHLDPNVFFPGTGICKDEIIPDSSVTAETNTNQDFNQGGMIPIIYLDGGELGAYIAFEWTSSRIIARGTADGVRMSVDFREYFTTRVKPNDEFIVPPIYIGVYDGDIDDGSNIFKRWFFLEKTPKTMLNNPNEPFAQIDAQIAPENAAEFGIQSIKWDYGWWSDKKITDNPSDIWKYYEGAWITGAERRGGMKEYGKRLRALGLNWTVYTLLHDSLIELEGDELMTSVGPTAHPEWFSDRKIAVCPVADLGNEECVDYCKRKLHQFFVKYNINSWRSDFEPIAHRSDKENRHDANGNDVQYWCSRGFYDIVDHILETIPGFRYESCSSGGSMKDYATMHRSSIFNNDDSANFNSLRTTFYDSSYCFPPAQLQAPCNPDTFCPDCEKYYAGIGDKNFGMRAMIMGAVMFGSWCGSNDGHLNHGLEKYYKEYINLHNEKVKPLIRDANLYHTLPRPDSIHWDGMQYGCDFIPDNKIGGALFLFKPTNEEGNTKTVGIRGLNPDFTYRADFYERTEQSYTVTGRELMENGLTCTINEDCGSEIVFFTICD